jgi:hypothetical protein
MSGTGGSAARFGRERGVERAALRQVFRQGLQIRSLIEECGELRVDKVASAHASSMSERARRRLGCASPGTLTTPLNAVKALRSRRLLLT